MSEENGTVASPAEITKPLAVSDAELPGANTALNHARNCFAACLVSYFGAAFVGAGWAALVPIVILVLLVLAYVFLGVAAARAGKSWVVYAILPLLVPGLGGLISFGVLRSKVPHVDD